MHWDVPKEEVLMTGYDTESDDEGGVGGMSGKWNQHGSRHNAGGWLMRVIFPINLLKNS